MKKTKQYFKYRITFKDLVHTEILTNKLSGRITKHLLSQNPEHKIEQGKFQKIPPCSCACNLNINNVEEIKPIDML